MNSKNALNKLVLVLLTVIALIYYFVWKEATYFKWDDLEFLLQSQSPSLKLIFTPVNEHFSPLFRSGFIIQTDLFGSSYQYFFLCSLLLHAFTMFLLLKILSSLTKSFWLSLAGTISFGVFGPLADVLPWPSMQQILGSTLFAGLTFSWYLRYLKTHSPWALAGLFFSSLFSGWWSGTGAGLGLALVGGEGLFYFLTRTRASKFHWSLIIAALSSAAISFSLILTFSRSSLALSHLTQWSTARVWSMIYYFLVGPSQGIISRFFIPGFSPNIYQPLNIITMIIVPAITLITFLKVIRQLKASPAGKKTLRILLTALMFFVYPYALSAPVRSLHGPVSALNYRYSHLPLFFWVIALFLILKTLLSQFRLPKLLLAIILSFYLIGQWRAFSLLITKIYY